MMKKFRIGLTVFAALSIALQLYIFDYKDLSWSNNSGHYLSIIAMICVIVSMIFSQRHENKQKE